MKIERMNLGPYAANCYIVYDEFSKDAIIIDPGSGGNEIVKWVQDTGLKIKYIVLTHNHPDHIGALKEVKEANGAPEAIHADDVRGLQRGHRYGQEGAQPLLAPDLLIKDGDSLDAGSLHFLVIHTPGHTQGGICLLTDGVLFSGDTLFNSSVGRSDMPGGNGVQLIQGIFAKLMTLPDETVILPGHGPETTIGRERRSNPFLRG